MLVGPRGVTGRLNPAESGEGLGLVCQPVWMVCGRVYPTDSVPSARHVPSSAGACDPFSNAAEAVPRVASGGSVPAGVRPPDPARVSWLFGGQHAEAKKLRVVCGFNWAVRLGSLEVSGS